MAAVAAAADHVAVPVLGLQEPAEPAAPLSQEGTDGRGCVGAGACAADDRRVPVKAVQDAIASEAMDQFVVFDEAVRVEAAHQHHGTAPESRKGPRYEQQAMQLRPGVARQEVAHVFVGLERREKPPRQGGAADRTEHARRGHEGRARRKGAADGRDGVRLEQGVGVKRHHQFGLDRGDGAVERHGFAAVRES